MLRGCKVPIARVVGDACGTLSRRGLFVAEERALRGAPTSHSPTRFWRGPALGGVVQEHAHDSAVDEPAETGVPLIIDVEGVRKDFGSGPVQRDLSRSMRQGEIFGLIGPSGSG